MEIESVVIPRSWRPSFCALLMLFSDSWMERLISKVAFGFRGQEAAVACFPLFIFLFNFLLCVLDWMVLSPDPIHQLGSF